MTQTYRTNDGARWGTGKGSDLSPQEVDINFWDLVQRMLAQEARPDPAAGIDAFSVSGTDFYVHMTDGTLYGPYPLPVAAFRARGTWTPSTAYSAMDTFDYGGSLYMVLLAHVSAATFDPGANDGLGHDYYGLMLEMPGNVLPTGGAVGQVLTKSTSADFATMWSYSIPAGGTTGQALVKTSSLDGEADWELIKAENVVFTPVEDSLLTSTTVADAIEEATHLIPDAPPLPVASDIAYTPNSAYGMTSTNVQGAISEVVTMNVGKQSIWIPATAMVQQTTNGPAFNVLELPLSKVMISTMDFDPAVQEYVQFAVVMPKSYDYTLPLNFTAYFSHTTASGNVGVVWKVEVADVYTSGIDVAFGSGTVSITATGGTRDTLWVSPVSDNLTPSGSRVSQAGVQYQFRISRDATNVNDTLGIDARLHGILMTYQTKRPTDT